MGKRLNLAQKAQKARQRKERRARIKQKMQQREFSLRNVLIGAGGARGASDGGNGASDGDNGGVPFSAYHRRRGLASALPCQGPPRPTRITEAI